MSTGGFDASLTFTLGYEGGWSDHPKDPGGATMCGITQRVYDEDRERRRLPLQSVRLSTRAERAAIYRRRYWDAAQGDQLPAGIGYATFDFAVNSGVGRAVKTLQMIVGATPDGVVGSATLRAVNNAAAEYGATWVTDKLCQKRMAFLRSLPTFATFGRGWTLRVMGHQDGTQSGDTGVIDRAFDMARGAVPTTPTTQVVTPKTYLARAA